MMLRNNKKKGELTTQQIVGLVILLISFAVVLFFLFRLELGKTSQEQLCRNSVLARGSSVLPNDAIPLDCKRAYVCITEDGSCEQMTQPEIKKVKTEEDVYEVLAKEMENCWWMFGEGEVNYVGKDTFPGLYCSICSQVAFDDSVHVGESALFSSGFIKEEELYRFLFNEKQSKEMNYSQYLYKYSGDFDGLKSYLNSEGIVFSNIELENQHYILTGMVSDVNTLGWVSYGAGIVGGVLALASIPLTGGISSIVAYGVVGGTTGAAGGFAGSWMIKGRDNEVYLVPRLIEANSDEFEALKCKSITTLS